MQTYIRISVARVGRQETICSAQTPANSASELMKCGQAESFGAFYQHDGSIRNIDTNLDNAGCDQDIDFGGHKIIHNGLFFFRAKAAMQQSNPALFERAFG